MDSVDDLFKRLEQLNEIGASLSKERDITRLLECHYQCRWWHPLSNDGGRSKPSV
jgi:hypothetical protein